MAAIIAQITRANRERIRKKRFEIIISKCMYEIKEFPDKYEPEVRDSFVVSCRGPVYIKLYHYIQVGR